MLGIRLGVQEEMGGGGGGGGAASAKREARDNHMF